jgi:hypothetical protein
MVLFMDVGQVIGLPQTERQMLQNLVEIYMSHNAKNWEKERYYEGNIPLSEVNLGIALPKSMRKLEIGCAWGSKAVDVLAARSMFDGFVDARGYQSQELAEIVADNDLITEYAKATRDELKFGSTYATLSADKTIGCKIRFHSPLTAAAHWNGEKGRIDYGFAVINSAPSNASIAWEPTLVNLYTEDAVWVLEKQKGLWRATGYPHRMGRPLMEAFRWNPTSSKPFGRSRIKEPVRRLIQGYVRTMANATIGLEFATSPQKYLLGVTDDQYDAVINDKFRQYVGSIIASTTNPETGEKPTFGQLAQGTIQPHVDMMRLLATQFSAATGLSVTDTGVVNDANPTSSEAIIAQTQTLIGMAEQLNQSNGDSLRIVAVMALAIANNVTMEELGEDRQNIIAHFKNPAMPSVASTTDAALKIASARQAFAQTDTFLEMIGFSQADIRRIKAEEQRSRGLAVLEEVNADTE